MSYPVYHIHTYCQGTGSYPNPPCGLHRLILFIPNQVPRIVPYFFMACAVYSLHVGVNLQTALPPVNGEMHN